MNTKIFVKWYFTHQFSEICLKLLSRMPSFQRMREDVEGIESKVSQKCSCIRSFGLINLVYIVTIAIAIVIIIGLSIGVSYNNSASINITEQIQTNMEESCPALKSEFLLSEIELGSSFEGFIANMICRSGYEAFPKVVRCVRKGKLLKWSHLPVCLPNQVEINNFKNFNCKGNHTTTTCEFTCKSNYVPIQPQSYVCNSSPCPKWSLDKDTKKPLMCYICDEKCNEFHNLNQKSINDEILKEFNCPLICKNVLITSKGNSSFRSPVSFGIYSLIGENHGHPLYFNKVNKYYLYYFNSQDWLLGDEIINLEANMQVATNTNSKLLCPDELKGKGIDKWFVDYSYDNKWYEDPEISYKCIEEKPKNQFFCRCKKYNFYYSTANNTSKIPHEVKYILNNYTINADKEKDLGISSQLYENEIKQINLFSNDGYFRVWNLNKNFLDTYAVGYIPGGTDKVCPDDERLTWKWFNTTTPENLNHYIQDDNLKVKCLKK